MIKISAAILAAAIAAAFAASASAQTSSQHDGYRPAAEASATPPAFGQDHKDVEKDKRDADLAITRDKCGEVSEDARERCAREAMAQRDHLNPGGHFVAPGSAMHK